jgi:ketosteroid isomerase-like protein
MRPIGLVLILLCATVPLVPAQDAADTAIQSKIIALEKAWNQSYKGGDTKALDEILDPAIVLVNDDGSVQTKAEFLASVHATNSHEQQVAPESMHVRVFGDVAIASGVMRVKGVEGGKAYTRREQFVDTWLYKSGNWVCIATDATPSRANSGILSDSCSRNPSGRRAELRGGAATATLGSVAGAPRSSQLSPEIHEDRHRQQDNREDPEGRITHSSFLSHAPILPPMCRSRET